jgi:HAD superfamily hydrolase (TIGR01509 family)
MPRIKTKPKALLFDLDGVLWFSVDAHRQAFEKAFREMGLPLRFTRRRFSPYSGMTTEKALEHVLKDRQIHWNQQRRDRFSEVKRIWAMRYLPTRAPLQARLLATLKQLHRCYRLAIVSSGHPRTVSLFLTRSRARRFFDAAISHADVGVSKPSPKVYRTALRKLRLHPKEALAIEDTVSGTRSAVGAGIPVIGMRGTCAPHLLRKAGAFKTISRITDLLPLCR